MGLREVRLGELVAVSAEFGWVNDLDGVCLTFARGVDEEAMLRGFGGDPARAVRCGAASDSSIQAIGGYRPLVRVGRRGAYGFAIELSSAEGIRHRVLRRLSAHGDAVSVHHNPAGLSWFAYARDGVVLTEFEPLHPAYRRGSEPDRLLSAMRSVGLDPDQPHNDVTRATEAALNLAAAVTGVALDLADVEATLLGDAVLPLLDDPPLVAVETLLRRDPVVYATVHSAPADLLGQVVLQFTRRIAAESGLDADPTIREALAHKETRPVREVEDDTPLGVSIRELRAQAHMSAVGGASSPDDRHGVEQRHAQLRRYQAAAVVQATLTRPPLVALGEVLGKGRLGASWRDELLSALAEVDVPPEAVRAAERVRDTRQAVRGSRGFGGGPSVVRAGRRGGAASATAWRRQTPPGSPNADHDE